MTSLSQIQIAEICDQVKDLLLKKNQSYGDAALNPLRCFSKASPIEQIKVRIDDKLSRVQSGSGIAYMDEDTLMDLIGYCILLKIAENRQKAEDGVPPKLACKKYDFSPASDWGSSEYAYEYYDHDNGSMIHLDLRKHEDLKFLERKWEENPKDKRLYSVWKKYSDELYSDWHMSDT